MKIEKLKLTNFRSHRSTELALDRINIIRGFHGAGKSSIQKAIEYALTGRCDLTDARGAGAENMITLGKNEMGVQLTLAGGAIVTRVRNRAGGNLIIGDGKKSFTGKVADNWIESYVGPADVLTAVFNASRFTRMNEKEQKALLAGALASDPVEMDAATLQLVNDVEKKQLESWSITGANDVDWAHKKYFDMRADRKRDLKAMGDAAEPDIPPDCPALDDVTEQIRELEKSVAELESARTTQLLRVERENSKLRSEYTEKKSRREAAERTVAEMDSWLIERAEEIDSLQRTLKKRGEAQKLDTLIADIKGRQQALRAERARLSAPLQTECPTCHRAYTDIPDHRARLAEIDNEMQVHSDILQKHQDAKNKLPDFDLIDDRLRKHQTAMPKVAAAQVVIDTMGELTEPAYEEADVSELDADIADLKGRIARGREIERTVVRYEEQRKQFQQAAERRAELERTIAKLEKLVEYFSDKGPIKAHLVGGKLPAFVERINEVLERFDFRCDFSLEPFSLIVGRGLDGNSGAKIGLRLNQLSESEEFRFGIAFQVALAEATGIGVVIIDRADMLLPEVRSTLTAAVMDSNLDQVFLLAAGEPMDEFPDVPETTFFELENADGYTVVTSHKSEVGDMTYAAE